MRIVWMAPLLTTALGNNLREISGNCQQQAHAGRGNSPIAVSMAHCSAGSPVRFATAAYLTHPAGVPTRVRERPAGRFRQLLEIIGEIRGIRMSRNGALQKKKQQWKS
jgi:hypothetical protein